MTPPVKFIFLILPNLHLLDLAGPDQTILESIEYGANFEMEYCGIDETPATSAGLQLKKQNHFSKVKLKKGDFIIIPGSSVQYILSDEFKVHTDLLNWIRTAYDQQEVNLVSICAGAFVLAQAGVLDGKQCTTHFKRTAQLQSLFPSIQVVEDVLFVEQDRIYSSAGIISGIDLMLCIIEKLTDSYFVHKVARELVMYIRRDGNSKQESVFLKFRNHIHSGIHQAQDFVVEKIHTKFSNTELADVANMSYRNFCRIFKKETGITPNEYINLIRLEKANSLIKNPDMSKQQIANAVGLKSEKQLSRLTSA
jgi:transcriptional regulator GlxA family with amidase domain